MIDFGTGVSPSLQALPERARKYVRRILFSSSSLIIVLQWLVEDASNGLFLFKNGAGDYLSFEGEVGVVVASRGRLVCTTTKQPWRLIVDTRRPDQIK